MHTATSAAIDSAADCDANHGHAPPEYAAPPTLKMTGVFKGGQPGFPLHCAKFAIAGGIAGIN